MSLRERQAEYWDSFRERAAARGSRFGSGGRFNGTYHDWPIGRSGYFLGAAIYLRPTSPIGARVQLAIEGERADANYARLKLAADEIAREAGRELVWDPKPGSKRCGVYADAGPAPRSREEWPDIQDWTLQTLEAFDRAFGPRM